MHNIYIQRCIELAQKAKGNTYPNPMVGAVIVYQNQIIGEGYHHKAGQPHAEINAINSVQDKSLLKDSTIYVSLEPCAHYGKTPPCAKAIADIGFKKVVIGAMDSNEKVSGKGKAMIEAAGIEVVSGILEQECRALNKRFLTYHEQKRPFITLKWAQSKDSFIDQDFKPTQISNPLASQLVHKMRSEEQSILVGTTTAIHDNPSLTNRHYAGNNPIRLLIDLDLKVPQHYQLFNSEAPTIIFNRHKEEEQAHLKWVKINPDDVLNNMLQRLYDMQIQSVLVEGGRYTLQQLIHQNLWDEAVIIEHSNLKLKNGTLAPEFNEIANYETKIRDNHLRYFQRHNF